MSKIPDDLLIKVYAKALRLKLDQYFILLIEREIKKRNIDSFVILENTNTNI
ncbi:sporulation histidine kinase inhibitor Sda [Alkalihalobacillus deserti]|uniref:sporulation histidine kinase inhibitor Sda n=1 Tax=Alkalihalobacillus deserti TaxID=2879466 RepID=UPI001D15472E|nr:sporulation histidine kinase inhibitor Sda [Alkalihalobacillus deserti]